MAQLRADGPAEVRFLFEDTQKRAGGAFGASLAIHAAAIMLGFSIASHPGGGTDTSALLPESLNKEIVWLAEPGAGGGGGSESPEPPREAELPGKEKMTVPVLEKSLIPEPTSDNEEPPPQQDLNIPAETLASSNVFVMGVMERELPSGPGLVAVVAQVPVPESVRVRVLALGPVLAAEPVGERIVRGTAWNCRACCGK